MTNNTTISFDSGKDVTYELMIEQLGGYEKMSKYVKDTLADLENDVPYDTNCYQFETEICFQFGQLQKALLEYRRAHNIFEVGDAIIRRWNGRLYWIITDVDHGSEFMISENKDAKFKDCKICDLPCNFTHATDAEIKANRCLDQ